jgi:hypothetical protein
MKAYGEVDVEIHIFLTSALVGGERSASRPGRFTPEERPSVISYRNNNLTSRYAHRSVWQMALLVKRPRRISRLKHLHFHILYIHQEVLRRTNAYFPSIWHGPNRKRNYGDAQTGPLPSNDGQGHTDTPTGRSSHKPRFIFNPISVLQKIRTLV